MDFWNSFKKIFLVFFYKFYYVLKKFFIFEDPSSPRKRTIQTKTKILLAKQFKDAEKKKRNSDYWGYTGWHVGEAAYKCSEILIWCDEESIEDYFDRVLPALERLAELYRNDPCEEGYGLGTVREVEHAITIVANKYKQ